MLVSSHLFLIGTFIGDLNLKVCLSISIFLSQGVLTIFLVLKKNPKIGKSYFKSTSICIFVVSPEAKGILKPFVKSLKAVQKKRRIF
jgi:hypothetical protein